MKYLIFIFILLLNGINSEKNNDNEFNKVCDKTLMPLETTTENINTGTSDLENNIIFAGTTTGPLYSQWYGNTDVIIIKMDKNCNILWNKQFGTTYYDHPLNIVVDNNNDIILTGIYDNTPYPYLFLAKIYKNGNFYNNDSPIVSIKKVDTMMQFVSDYKWSYLCWKNIGLGLYSRWGHTSTIYSFTKSYIKTILYNIDTAISLRMIVKSKELNSYVIEKYRVDNISKVYWNYTINAEGQLCNCDTWNYNLWEPSGYKTLIQDMTIDLNKNILLIGSTKLNKFAINEGKYDVVIEKIDSITGKQIWGKMIGDSFSNYGRRIFVDQYNNILIYYESSYSNNEYNDYREADIYITKINQEGFIVWKKKIIKATYSETFMEYIYLNKEYELTIFINNAYVKNENNENEYIGNCMYVLDKNGEYKNDCINYPSIVHMFSDMNNNIINYKHDDHNVIIEKIKNNIIFKDYQKKEIYSDNKTVTIVNDDTDNILENTMDFIMEWLIIIPIFVLCCCCGFYCYLKEILTDATSDDVTICNITCICCNYIFGGN